MAVTVNGYTPGVIVESVVIVKLLPLVSPGPTGKLPGEKLEQEVVVGKPLQLTLNVLDPTPVELTLAVQRDVSPGPGVESSLVEVNPPKTLSRKGAIEPNAGTKLYAIAVVPFD